MTTIAITLTATPVFALGRTYRAAEAQIVQTLKTDNLAAQTKAKLDLKAGIMAAILCKADLAADAAASYISGVLNKSGKDRTDAEAKAENAARTRISRIMETYNIKSLEPRGGSANAKSGKAKAKAKKAKGLKADAPKAKAVIPQAVYVSPVIKKAEDWSNHLSFVTKELGLTLKKAEVQLTKAKADAYRKALSHFMSDIKKIMA